MNQSIPGWAADNALLWLEADTSSIIEDSESDQAIWLNKANPANSMRFVSTRFVKIKNRFGRVKNLKIFKRLILSDISWKS